MKFRTSSLVFVSLLAGLGGGFFLGSRGPSDGAASINQLVSTVFQDASGGFQESRSDASGLINPLLDCSADAADFTELTPFKKKITALIDQRTQSGDISDAAVYFRDMNNGPWFGVNENEKFQPGSLLKIPLAISYYQYASHSQGIFEQKFAWKPDPSNPMGPPVTLKAGEMYTVRELIRRMLVNSDNAATDILYNHLPPQDFSEPYKDFGQPVPDPKDSDFSVSVRGYTSFLRILYNASYLTRDASQDVLAQLAQSDFTTGLRAGTPPSVPIAHKYGERLYSSEDNELHDCGIVYYPKHPYLLCVMTKGKSIEKMGNTIRDVAALVYHEVNVQLSQ